MCWSNTFLSYNNNLVYFQYQLIKLVHGCRQLFQPTEMQSVPYLKFWIFSDVCCLRRGKLMSNGDNCRISSQKAEVTATAVDLPLANVLIFLYELPFFSLHKATSTLFWIGIALRNRVSLFLSLLVNNSEFYNGLKRWPELSNIRIFDIRNLRRQWRLSGIFIVNFVPFSSISIAKFEHLHVSWVKFCGLNYN